MYQKPLVCARFQAWGGLKTVFISLEKTQGQMEQNGVIFHFWRISFTKRFHFCFKKVNNFEIRFDFQKVTKF